MNKIPWTSPLCNYLVSLNFKGFLLIFEQLWASLSTGWHDNLVILGNSEAFPFKQQKRGQSRKRVKRKEIHLAWCLQMVSVGCFTALRSHFQKPWPQHIPVVRSQRAPVTQTAPRTPRARAAQVTVKRTSPVKLRLLRYRVPSRRQSKMAAFWLLGLVSRCAPDHGAE